MFIVVLLRWCSLLVMAVSACPLCHTCWPSEIYTQPAVGLDFGPSYGRVVFKWANGTVEEITKIRGGPEYVASMLEILHSYQTQDFATVLQYETLAARDIASSNKYRLQQTVLGDNKQNYTGLQLSFKPFEIMALQLRNQIERSLPYPIAMLGVTHPLVFSTKHRECLQDVVRVAGLRASLSYHQTSSPFAAAAANGIRLCKCPMFAQACASEAVIEREMTLYIEYTELTLTIFLYEGLNPEMWNDGGIAYIRRTPSEDDEIQADFWNSTTGVLRMMISEALRKRIDYIVLSGTLAGDTHLHEAIQFGVGLGVGYKPNLNLVDACEDDSSLCTQMVDPALAPAQGVADLSWRRNMRTCLDPCSGWRQLPQCNSGSGWRQLPQYNSGSGWGFKTSHYGICMQSLSER